jgi:hypothetical protein
MKQEAKGYFVFILYQKNLLRMEPALNVNLSYQHIYLVMKKY